MLPELHLTDWRATKDTLHLYCQVIGKIRLATTAPRNHWWNVPLYVDVRGLTTRRLHHAGTTFDIALDFVDHAVVVRTADGRREAFALHEGLDVAAFDRRLHAALAGLGIDVEIRELPFGVPMTTPFPSDHEHAAWDREHAGAGVRPRATDQGLVAQATGLGRGVGVEGGVAEVVVAGPESE